MEIKNSGVRDITRNLEIHLVLSNPKMAFQSHSFSNSTSTTQRNLAASELTISKSLFTAREEEVIAFESLVDYQTNSDDKNSEASIGKIVVSMTYFGSTIIVKELNFKEYSVYSSILDKYYGSNIDWLAILFVIWFILHGTFLVLQIKFNITQIIKEKFIKKTEEKQQDLNIMTKEDHAISEHIVNEVNLTGEVKNLKESLTISRSNADLLPKLLTNDGSSLRSSKDREVLKEEDSGEI